MSCNKTKDSSLIVTRRTKHFFTSAQGRNNGQGRFEFTFREPVFNILSGKVKKVVIPNFVGIANSPYYFLRTDGISLTRDASTYNGVPSQIVAIIPYTPNIAGSAVSITEEDDSEPYNFTSILQNLWFELLDYQGNVINPNDVGWSFGVELQFIIQYQ